MKKVKCLVFLNEESYSIVQDVKEGTKQMEKAVWRRNTQNMEMTFKLNLSRPKKASVVKDEKNSSKCLGRKRSPINFLALVTKISSAWMLCLCTPCICQNSLSCDCEWIMCETNPNHFLENSHLEVFLKKSQCLCYQVLASLLEMTSLGKNM